MEWLTEITPQITWQKKSSNDIDLASQNHTLWPLTRMGFTISGMGVCGICVCAVCRSYISRIDIQDHQSYTHHARHNAPTHIHPLTHSCTHALMHPCTAIAPLGAFSGHMRCNDVSESDYGFCSHKLFIIQLKMYPLPRRERKQNMQTHTLCCQHTHTSALCRSYQKIARLLMHRLPHSTQHTRTPNNPSIPIGASNIHQPALWQQTGG